LTVDTQAFKQALDTTNLFQLVERLGVDEHGEVDGFSRNGVGSVVSFDGSRWAISGAHSSLLVLLVLLVLAVHAEYRW
jgi:hypothetical protein